MKAEIRRLHERLRELRSILHRGPSSLHVKETHLAIRELEGMLEESQSIVKALESDSSHSYKNVQSNYRIVMVANF